MLNYIANKVFYGFLTLFGVVSVIFILFHILPGDSARMMLDQRENTTQLEYIRKKYAFDKPIFIQYLYYLNDLSIVSFHSLDTENYTFISKNKYKYIPLFSTDRLLVVVKFPYLRQSLQKNGKKVSELIKETLPNTIVLAVSAISIAMIVGIGLGMLSSIYKDSLFDKLTAVFSTLGMSLPSFFSAILFAWFFGFVLHNVTGLKMTGSLYEVDDFGEGVYLKWKNLLLPSVVLGIRPLAVIAQLMRNSLLETLSQEYIKTAKAKGLSMRKVILNHALKNSLNPVLTAVSGWFASMLAGAVFVEYIFNWNGLGKEIVNSLNTLDLPVIMGSVLVIATLFICINILVDILYGWLDPRVRLASK
ncbi:MAG: ABC transporter permease [Tenacibaculum sp.]